MSALSQPEPESIREVFTTRVLNARRETVFRAFSDPLHLAKWWGPKHFTNTFYEFDLRPGGYWRFIMHGPDGVDYPNESVFVEIMKPELIMFKHISKPTFEMGIALADRNGCTQIGWRMVFDTRAECDRLKKFVIGANEQNLDRLEIELASMT